MQNKKRPAQNRNSAYYKSQVRRPNRGGFDFHDTAKKRQMNSYLRAIAVLVVFMTAVLGFIFLGIFLKNVVTNEPNSGRDKNASDNPDDENMGIFSYDDDTGESENGTEPAVDISAIYQNYNGVYLDIQKLNTLENLQLFIADIKEKGINAVNIDIKNEAGNIPFALNSPTAILVGAIDANENLAIRAIIDMLHENDIYVSGTISCFKDDFASATYPRYSLLRKSDGLRWSDANDSSWLNVYSEGARNYIKEIVLEIINLNFDEIILSQFFFPNLANPNDLDYANDVVGKYDMVTQFIREMREAVNMASNPIKLGINIPLRYFLQIPHPVTGIDPNILLEEELCDFIVTSFAPSEIPASITVGGSVIENAAQNPYDSVKKLCEHFKDYTSRTMFRPSLQAYDSPEGIIFSAEQINAQKQALFESDIKVWELVNYNNLY